MSETATDTTDSPPETVTVQVWDRRLTADYDEMDADDPDAEIELPLWDGSEIWSEKYEHVLADDIQNHRKYAFHVKGADELEAAVKVKVFSNDSLHTPDEWGRPIEGGLQFPSGTKEPFKVEMWGRIKLEVAQA